MVDEGDLDAFDTRPAFRTKDSDSSNSMKKRLGKFEATLATVVKSGAAECL